MFSSLASWIYWCILLIFWTYLFWTVHVNKIIHYVILCVWLLSSSVMFSRFTHLTYFVPLYDQIIVHCMDIPHFVDPFMGKWVVSTFNYYSNAAVKIYAQVSGWTYVFRSFEAILSARSRWLVFQLELHTEGKMFMLTYTFLLSYIIPTIKWYELLLRTFLQQ